MARTGRSGALALYNAAIVAGSPVLLAYLGYRLARGKSREGWRERWGCLPETLRRADRPRLWCHAASVGETMAAQPILKEVLARSPDLECVMTTITPGGHEVALASVGKTVQAVAYLPFDLLPIVRKTVSHISPDVFVGVETEIWPNLLFTLRRKSIPAVLVNGRISDRSFPRYRRLRWLLRSVLACYTAILAQSDVDAERFIALGAPEESVRVVGNVKFDQAGEPEEPERVGLLRQEFRIQEGAPVFVVGSTRVPAEEKLIMDAFLLMRARIPNLVLIHAPRHVERAESVMDAMREAGLPAVRRTRLADVEGPAEVIVLDTFGELARVYALGDVAFVGNSLVPPGGGQNPLQPLAQGKPVLFGPHMSNFRDVASTALDSGVAFQVASSEELADRVAQLLGDTAVRADIAQRAIALIRRHRGAARRCADTILGCLSGSPISGTAA